MAIDASTPDTPDWWLIYLGKQLQADMPRLELLDRYMSGDHPLPEGHRRHRQTFRALQRHARTNYCGMVAEAVIERQHIDGFRTSDGNTDAEAWRIFQANRLDAFSGLVHTAARTFGRGYVMVGPNPNDPTTPIISIEDPRQVIHAADPARFGVTRAALKVWTDDVTGDRHAVLQLQDGRVVYYVSPKGQRRSPWSPASWELDTSEGDNGVATNPAGRVSIVPFVNRPRLGSMGLGEFEDVIDVQNRINNTILDRLVIAKMQAYRQRYATGLKDTDENGNPIDLDPGADLLWSVQDDKAKFGEFGETNMDGILKSIDADVRDISAVTRTPAHYMLADMANLSGDALQAAEIGLVAKTGIRNLHDGESWEDVMALAALTAGREADTQAEVIWRDPQFRTVAELYDAAVKAQSAGVPWRSRMELLRKTPQEIARMETERTEDALLLAQYPQLAANARFTDTITERENSKPGQPATDIVPGAPQPGAAAPAAQ